ncbi:hypothetical protein MMC18_009682 [Xylographa bjoerkii]|nr:hypothetical protein [Xylographa bjoerkii]
MPFLRSISQRLQNRLSSKPIPTSTSATTFQSTSQSKNPNTMAAPIVLILGSGPRVGAAVSETFAANGYQVAVAARKGTNSKTENGVLSIKADFTHPESVATVFDAVKAEFGAAPGIVIYNAAALTPPSDKESALSIPAAKVTSDLNVNVVSPYVAAQEAIKGWATLPAHAKKTFIYTGNIQNEAVLPVPMMLNLGVGKAASAYWVGLADGAYSAQGYRFIYADERHPDGKFKGMALDGPAHGDFYAQLAKSTEGVPWHATFVKDKGYVSFK